jgi:hypothetical protein
MVRKIPAHARAITATPDGVRRVIARAIGAALGKPGAATRSRRCNGHDR